jgi:hypothetical protein
MRRIPDSDPGGEWVDHVFYPDTTRTDYLVAKAALNERRRARRERLLAGIELERGE